MPGHAAATSEKRRRLPRLTIAVFMVVIAVVAVWLAWFVDRSRRHAIITLRAPNLIAVGDTAHDIPSLRKYPASGRVEKVVIRAASDVPHSAVLEVTSIAGAAGIRDLQIGGMPAPPK